MKRDGFNIGTPYFDNDSRICFKTVSAAQRLVFVVVVVVCFLSKSRSAQTRYYRNPSRAPRRRDTIEWQARRDRLTAHDDSRFNSKTGICRIGVGAIKMRIQIRSHNSKPLMLDRPGHAIQATHGQIPQFTMKLKDRTRRRKHGRLQNTELPLSAG
jgi:hypothetical protein